MGENSTKSSGGPSTGRSPASETVGKIRQVIEKAAAQVTEAVAEIAHVAQGWSPTPVPVPVRVRYRSRR
jgi:hypothetical protein